MSKRIVLWRVFVQDKMVNTKLNDLYNLVYEIEERWVQRLHKEIALSDKRVVRSYDAWVRYIGKPTHAQIIEANYQRTGFRP